MASSTPTACHDAVVRAHADVDYVPAAKGFALASTVLVAAVILGNVAIFWWFQRRFVLLRKRSFPLVCIAAFGALLNWMVVFVRDSVGPANFNCVLFAVGNYAVVPFLGTPLLLRLARFSNEQQLAQMRRASIHSLSSTSTSSGSFLPNLTLPKVDCEAFSAYLRGGTKVRRRRATIVPEQEKRRHELALAFASSSYYVPFWVSAALLPYLVGFFVKLPYTPAWIENCDGCDLDVGDVGFFLAAVSIIVAAGIWLITPLLFKPDPLAHVPEFVAAWTIGGTFALLGLVLYVIDPGQLMAQRIFYWRWLISGFGATGFLVAQSGFPVILAFVYQRAIIRSPSIVPRDRLTDVLNDVAMRSALYAHLARELSTELLLFIDAVDRWRNGFDKEGRNRRARDIYDTFLVPRAHMEVNISAATRDRVADLVERGDPPRDVFDRSYDEVYNVLLTDSFPRFLASQNQGNGNSDGVIVANSALAHIA